MHGPSRPGGPHCTAGAWAREPEFRVRLGLGVNRLGRLNPGLAHHRVVTKPAPVTVVRRASLTEPRRAVPRVKPAAAAARAGLPVRGTVTAHLPVSESWGHRSQRAPPPDYIYIWGIRLKVSEPPPDPAAGAARSTPTRSRDRPGPADAATDDSDQKKTLSLTRRWERHGSGMPIMMGAGGRTLSVVKPRDHQKCCISGSVQVAGSGARSH